jgi:hypothetical protein
LDYYVADNSDNWKTNDDRLINIIEDIFNLEETGTQPMIGARLKNNANQTIPVSDLIATFPDPQATSGCWDTDAFWNSGQPTRLTTPNGLGGKYIIVANTRIASSGGILAELNILKNGISIATEKRDDTGIQKSLNVSTIHDLVEGDYIEILLINYSPTTGITLVGTGTDSPVLAIEKID